MKTLSEQEQAAQQTEQQAMRQMEQQAVKVRVLILEQDADVRELLGDYLEMNGFEVEGFGRPEMALMAFQKRKHEVCILNIETAAPDKALLLAEEIVAMQANTVVVFTGMRLTGKLVVRAYECWADDVIRKPLYLEEVLARLQAILRRTYIPERTVRQTFVIGKYHFDPLTQRLQKMPKGERVKLTTKETELLTFLCEHKNQVVSRAEVIKEVWQDTSFYNARSMEIYIAKLRRRLEGDPSVKIVGLHSEGYRLQDNTKR